MKENEIKTFANKKDRLLSIILKSKGKMFHFSDFNHNVFNTNELQVLYKAIINDERNIVNGSAEYQQWIKANDLTESFLQNGGYTGIERSKKQKETIEIDLAKSNIDANKLNKKIAKQNAKKEKRNRVERWINIAIGILNAVLLAWQILKG